MRRFLRWLGIAGLVLLLVVVGLLVLPASETGSRWLLGRVPGLVVEDFHGRLLGTWRASALRWQSGDTRVALEQPQVALRLGCIRQGLLCVDELSSERMQLELPPSEASSEPLQIPEIRLPLGLEVNRLHLGSLQINGVEQITGLDLAAKLDQQGLVLSSLDLEHLPVRLSLSALNVKPEGDWPLSANLQVDLPPVDGREWRLDVEVKGSLKQRLELTGRSQGYLEGELSGWVAPMAKGLPLELQLKAHDFQALRSLPATLGLSTVGIRASGDLEAGYVVDGSGTLAGDSHPVAVSLRGTVQKTGALVERLHLEDDGGEHLQLSGTLAWQQGFSADATLEGTAFNWQQLYPKPEVKLQLEQLQATVKYAAGSYQGDFDVNLKSPAGPMRLRGPFKGTRDGIELPTLRMDAGKGYTEGPLAVTFAPLGWQTRQLISDVDPAFWVEQLPGQIAGALNSSGTLHDGQLQMQADWALDGRLREQPLRLKGQLRGERQHWQVDALDLRLGDNHVDGNLALNEQLGGRLKLALARLDQLWPGLGGSLEGDLALAGSLAAPQGNLVMRGQGLTYQQHRVAELSVDAHLDAGQQARMQLEANGLRSGKGDFGRLTLSGSGSLQRHRLELNLLGESLKADMAVAGGLSATNEWRGTVEHGSLSAIGFDWQLQQPASLERKPEGLITLGAHCWRSQSASLCADAQRLYPEPQLRMRLRDFELARLREILPRGMRLEGTLVGDLRLDLPASGPSGEVRLDAGHGQLRLRQAGERLEIPYQQLSFTSRLRPQSVDSQLRLNGATLGSLEVDASIDPRPANKPLSGSFHINGLDLALARPFAQQVERLDGRIDGSGRLSGSLMAPVVNGNVRLRNGYIGGGDLPLTFEQLQLGLDIRGQHAELDGSWRSGTAGQGNIAGSLHWLGEPRGDVRIRGSRLPAVVDPYADLEVDPDLQVTLLGKQVTLGGQVAIPRGKITVRELPTQAVSVSDDARIVGEEPVEESGPTMKMDVRLLIGEDRLRFSGFGLTADLKGNLRIRDNLNSRGSLRLENGRYRAYGQRLTLRRARLLFAGPIDQPLLDIEAIRQVDEVVAGLRINGRAEQPITEVFSEPTMSQQEALSYLVLGRPLSGSGDSNALSQAALALGLAGGTPVGSAIAERLGIQDFSLDSEGTGDSSNVVASGRISDRLSLRYGVGVFESGSIIALRYELSKKLYLEAASGLASSLDLFYKRDY